MDELTKYSTRSAGVVADAVDTIKDAFDFVNNLTLDPTGELYKMELNSYVNMIFECFTDLGIRIIFIIDEFDRAEDIFTDGAFFQRLFSLSPKGSPTPLSLSIITVSRRRVAHIAHHMQEGSNFEDAFPSVVLRGFDNEELEQYFSLYKQLPCGVLSEETRRQILYLCGRSPNLLMLMLQAVASSGASTVDVAELYSEQRDNFTNPFERMISLMEDTKADRKNGQRPLIDVFVQEFIGPAYDPFFEQDRHQLYDCGFVTNATKWDDIFLLSGISDQKRRSTFEPISPYFVEYVHYRYVKENYKTLAELLIRAERLARDVIRLEMSRAYPDDWEYLVNLFAPKKDYYLDTLRERVLQNDFSDSTVTKLNVISFTEYYGIIKEYNRLFAGYLKGYPFHQLQADMRLMSEGRNDSAHLNLEVYNNQSKKELECACNRFIQAMQSKTQPAPAPIATATTEPARATPSADEINALVANHTRVTFHCTAIKEPKGNLRGYLVKEGFEASVSKKSLIDLAVDPAVGVEFEAEVYRWDNGAQLFNLCAPGKSPLGVG